MGQEVVQLQLPGIVAALEAFGASEGRDAAFDTDARARKGGEVPGAADKSGSFVDSVFFLSHCSYRSQPTFMLMRNPS